MVRQRMGWNIKEAAFACGVKGTSWRGWELEGRRPRDLDDVCLKIASHTGCNDYWLMTGRTTPNGGGGGESRPRESNPRPSHYE